MADLGPTYGEVADEVNRARAYPAKAINDIGEIYSCLVGVLERYMDSVIGEGNWELSPRIAEPVRSQQAAKFFEKAKDLRVQAGYRD